MRRCISPKLASPPSNVPLPCRRTPHCRPAARPSQSPQLTACLSCVQALVSASALVLHISNAHPHILAPLLIPWASRKYPLEHLTRPIGWREYGSAHNGTVSEPASTDGRAPPNEGSERERSRPQSHHPQPNFVPPLENHPAAPVDIECQTRRKEPQDFDPRVYGMRCWKGTITMGQGACTQPGQDRAHEGCSWHFLASRNPRKQPEAGARQ